MKNRICVLGGMNMDITGAPHASLCPGDSNPGTVRMTPGGVGRNIAENLARMGFQVELMAPLGNDGFATLLRQACMQDGIGLSLAPSLPMASSVYLCLMDGRGDMYAAVNDMALCESLSVGQLPLDALSAFHGVVLDAKQFPTRSVEEPDTSRVLRGSHDGFVENLMQNAALLRRRVRDTHLRLERLQLPERSGTDVALCYMEGEADEGLLRALREKLMHIQVRSVAMSQETIAEAIAPRQFWNPFPKVRYTERPDVATACIMEGDVVVLVDNSASALLLPTTILRFNEEINDYYFPPLIGTYLQIIRTLVLLLTMFITPLWYLLVKNPDTLHENLRFLLVQDEYYVPLIVQLLLVELIIDILKIASLNTPDVLSNSFSMLGALILGDFAVQARWLVPEVLVYMAFVAVANYAQHSYEMGYATKLCRMLLLVLIWLWDWWGFAAGIVITLTLIVTAKPLVGKGYLYPLIPFDRKKLARLLYRRPVTKKNS